MRKNGCFDRAPLKSRVMVQDGWWPDGTRHMVEIPDPMTKDCQYQADDKYNDPQCVGCKHLARAHFTKENT